MYIYIYIYAHISFLQREPTPSCPMPLPWGQQKGVLVNLRFVMLRSNNSNTDSNEVEAEDDFDSLWRYGRDVARQKCFSRTSSAMESRRCTL